MTCREFDEFLSDFISGQLEPPQRREFERHLGACVACRRYLHGYAETVRLGRSLCSDPDEPLPAEVPEELVRAILRARRPS